MATSSDLFTLSSAEVGVRLDKLLSKRFPEHSRTYFQELIEKGCVLVNGVPMKKREIPGVDDEIEVLFALRPQIDLTPENIPLDVLYEDEYLLAVNKPAGMVVHPAPGNPSHTFVNALLYHCQVSHTDALRPGIVHRLDKDTSGVLIAAKTEETHSKLVTLFAERQVRKHYLAIAYGHLQDGIIDLPIGRHTRERQKMAVNLNSGRQALTQCETLLAAGDLSLIKITLLTGRTHQIRVHLAHKNAPVLGDTTYGSSAANQTYQTKRQLLHAYEISFEHPILKKELSFQAPLPQDFLAFASFQPAYVQFT